MPANLSHSYLNAEKKYRRAATLQEELVGLQEMLRELPKHKGTEKLQAELKRRISSIRKLLQKPQSRAAGFRLPRQGAARVVLIGGPSSGKSELFNRLTGIDPPQKTAAYPFTTLDPRPGICRCHDVGIQLVDTPAIAPGRYESRTESLVRGADLVLFLIDLRHDESIDAAVDAFQTVQSSRSRLGIENGIDSAEVGVTWTRALKVWNISELPQQRERLELCNEILASCHCWPGLQQAWFDSATGNDLTKLRGSIFAATDLIRVFTRRPGDKEMNPDPVGMSAGATVYDLAMELHQELAAGFHSARIWRQNQTEPITVMANHRLVDGDLVEIRTR